MKLNIFKKLLMFFMIFIGIIICGYSSLTDDMIRYYSFDNIDTSNSTSIDLTGNQNGDIVGLTTGVTGKLGEAYESSGGNEYVFSPYVGTDSFSVQVWVKGSGIYDIISSDSEVGNNRSWTLRPGLGANWLGSNINLVNPTTTINDNNWHHVILTYDTTTLRLYVDGVLEDSDSTHSGNSNNANTNFYVFKRKDASTLSFDGIVDEVAIWERGLNQSEVNELYNNGTGFNPFSILEPQIDFKNITINGKEINTSQSFVTNELDFNVSVEIIQNSTNDQINQTYNLYFNQTLNDSQQYATNSLNGTFALNLTTQGEYNISFFAQNNETNTSKGNFSLIIDFTPPQIDLNLSDEYNFYTINWTQFLNVSDVMDRPFGTEIISCIINFSVGPSTNCTDQAYTFVRNGNITYNITAIDDAGNIASLVNNLVLVNPFVYFNFQDFSSNQLFNFTLGGRNDNQTGVVRYKIYNDSLILGNNTLLFQKIGYQSTQVNFTLNLTSQLNLTTAVGISLLYLNIYDTNTDQLLNQQVDIALIGDNFAGQFQTSNGTIIIENITNIPGFYQLELDSNGYAKLIYIFQHTGFEAVNLSLFMQSINDTIPVLYIVQDKLGNRMGSSDEFPKCLVQVAEYDITTNSYILQTMDYTNSNGEIIFELDTTKNIKNTVICDSGTFIFEGEKITSTPVILTIGAEAIDYFDSQLNIAYTPINFTIVNNQTARYTLAYADSNGIVSQACLNVYEREFNKETFVGEQCLSTASGSLNIDFNASEGQTFIARGYFIYNSIQYGVPSRVDVIPIAYEDLGIIGLFITGLLCFALGLAGLSMPQGARWLGVILGGTLGLWIGSVANFIPMNYYVLTTWTVLLMMGAIFN